MVIPNQAAVPAPPSRETLRLALREANVRLGSHGGSIDVLDVSPEGEVTLEFFGACAACPSRPTTYVATVLPEIEKQPGVTRASVKGMAISERAIARIRSVFG